MQDELADAAIATLQQVTGDEDDFTAVDTALATLRDVTRHMQDKDGQWAMYLIAFAARSRMRFELLGEPETSRTLLWLSARRSTRHPRSCTSICGAT